MCLCCGGEKTSWLYFQIMRDPDSGNSRGFGFISYDSFESSDASIEVSEVDWSRSCQYIARRVYIRRRLDIRKVHIIAMVDIVQAMNGQYLCNRPITVSYAYKKDTKGERHGTHAGKYRSAVMRSCSL